MYEAPLARSSEKSRVHLFRVERFIVILTVFGDSCCRRRKRCPVSYPRSAHSASRKVVVSVSAGVTLTGLRRRTALGGWLRSAGRGLLPALFGSSGAFNDIWYPKFGFPKPCNATRSLLAARRGRRRDGRGRCSMYLFRDWSPERSSTRLTP